MIKSFRHKGLKRFFSTESKAGIQPAHAERLRLILALLQTADGPKDMNAPDLALHELSGKRKGTWAVTVRANWRITFRFDGADVVAVNYEDYH